MLIIMLAFNLHLYNLFPENNRLIDYLDRDVFIEPEGNLLNLFQNIRPISKSDNIYAVDYIRWKSAYPDSDDKPHLPKTFIWKPISIVKETTNFYFNRLKGLSLEELLKEIGYVEKYKVYSIAIKKEWDSKLDDYSYCYWFLLEYHDVHIKEYDCKSKLIEVEIKNIDELIHADDPNALLTLNKYFHGKYGRHSVILEEDENDFYNPNIEIYKMFDKIGKDIGSNAGNVRLVTYKGKEYVLKNRLTYVFDRTDTAREQWRSDGCIKEMDMSYFLEDLRIPFTRLNHNIFVKREYCQRWKNYQNIFYILMEYVPGDSVLWFDYGVTFNGHKLGRKLTISSAKTFMIEVFETLVLLLKANILPHQYNDDNIIMIYDNDKISWKFVNYNNYELNPIKVDADDCRWIVSNMKSMFTWRVCEYTGYSNHKRAPEKHHPFWKDLEKIFDYHYDKFSNIQDKACKGYGDWPNDSLDSLIEFSNEVLSYLKKYNAIKSLY